MRAFMTYIDALEAWNFRDIMACFDEALEHRILPYALGRPVLNKRQYGEYLRAVMSLMKGCQITIHEVIETGDKITAHVLSTGQTASDVPYVQEYMLVISFVPPPPSPTGGYALPKMRYVKEFVDSVSSQRFFAEEGARARLREEEQQRINSRKREFGRRGW